MSDLHLPYCLLNLDDIVIYSKTYEEHLSHLKTFLQKLSYRSEIEFTKM